MRKECRELKNLDKLDEFSSDVKGNRVIKSRQTFMKNRELI